MSKQSVAVITGASSGIGAAIALEFAGLGYRLTIAGRDAQRLEDTRRSCLAKDATIAVNVVCGDLSSEEHLLKLVHSTVSVFGQLDVLICNAAVTAKVCNLTCPIDVFDQIFQVNVRSTIRLTQLCLPHLHKSSRGNILYISSANSTAPLAVSTYYCMSKAAVDQLAKCLALELGQHNIRVNTINPGKTDTPIFRRLGFSDLQLSQLDELVAKSHPLGRGATPDEVAKAAAFLCSENASFITGQQLFVDGGYCMKRGF